jgi:hypothetical protein
MRLRRFRIPRPRAADHRLLFARGPDTGRVVWLLVDVRTGRVQRFGYVAKG